MGTPATLKEWVRRLSEEEMPVLAHTARRIADISARPESSAAELAQAILQDGSMTARVLRMANSVYYNPGGQDITTVSRAVVMLGFDVVSAIAISIAMIDSMLGGMRQERVLEEMACSFHAAVQAKGFAEARGDVNPEEVFIATLLHHLGHMAFWCFPYGLDQQLDDELRLTSEVGGPEEAEQRVLGFSLLELTAALNEEWHLSDLLADAFKGRRGGNPRVGSLELAEELARAVRISWHGEETAASLKRISEYLYLPLEECRAMAEVNALKARQMATDYGAAAAARLIPLAREQAEAKRAPPARLAPMGDPQLQLGVLREISAMLNERVELNDLLSLVLEGIYRGIGMDRAVLALISPEGTVLRGKYALGEGREALMNCFALRLDRENLFAYALKNNQAIWVEERGRIHWQDLISDEVRACVGDGDFFIMPLAIGGRPRGLFFADRALSGAPLDETAYNGFKHFCEQAQLGLSVLGMRR